MNGVHRQFLVELPCSNVTTESYQYLLKCCLRKLRLFSSGFHTEVFSEYFNDIIICTVDNVIYKLLANLHLETLFLDRQDGLFYIQPFY